MTSKGTSEPRGRDGKTSAISSTRMTCQRILHFWKSALSSVFHVRFPSLALYRSSLDTTKKPQILLIKGLATQWSDLLMGPESFEGYIQKWCDPQNPRYPPNRFSLYPYKLTRSSKHSTSPPSQSQQRHLYSCLCRSRGRITVESLPGSFC